MGCILKRLRNTQVQSQGRDTRQFQDDLARVCLKEGHGNWKSGWGILRTQSVCPQLCLREATRRVHHILAHVSTPQATLSGLAYTLRRTGHPVLVVCFTFALESSLSWEFSNVSQYPLNLDNCKHVFDCLMLGTTKPDKGLLVHSNCCKEILPP